MRTTHRKTALIGAGLFVLACTLVLAVVLDHSGGNPPSPSVATERAQGLADGQQGDCAAAILLLRPIVAADPADLASREALGVCYGQQAAYAEALPLLRQVVAAQPTLSNEINLSEYAFNAGQVSISQKALAAAISLTGSPAGLISLAGTAESYDFYNTAMQGLARVPVQDRTYNWYDVHAKAEDGLGFAKAAITDAQTAVHLAPNADRALVLLDYGNILSHASECNQAIPVYNEAIALHQDIDLPSTYRQLTQCAIDLNEFSTAVQFAAAGESNSYTASDYSTFAYYLADAYAGLHQFSRASSLLHSIISSQRTPLDIQQSAETLLAAISS